MVAPAAFHPIGSSSHYPMGADLFTFIAVEAMFAGSSRADSTETILHLTPSNPL